LVSSLSSRLVLCVAFHPQLFFLPSIYEYSRSHGILFLSKRDRAHFNVTTVNVTLDWTDACFGNAATATLLESVVGYDTALLNAVLAAFGPRGRVECGSLVLHWLILGRWPTRVHPFVFEWYRCGRLLRCCVLVWFVAVVVVVCVCVFSLLCGLSSLPLLCVFLLSLVLSVSLSVCLSVCLSLSLSLV
jgi:Tumour-associated protein